MVGFTGTARHPKALAVRLPDGRVALSQRLTTALSSVVTPRLVPQAGRTFTKAGDSYTPATGDVVVTPRGRSSDPRDRAAASRGVRGEGAGQRWRAWGAGRSQ